MTSNERPPEIRGEHLAKLALVYVRQSSPEQVRDNTGSTAAQMALAALPRQWGWPDSRIKIVDGDLGQSGSSMLNRTAFQEMLDLIDRKQVGLVAVRDVSRLSRDTFDSELFLRKAIRSGVLILTNGRIFDAATEDLAELFGIRIQSLLAWFENQHRIRTFRAARLAKARQGHAVTVPPVGYVQSVRGKWIKDPDVKVQDAVRSVFAFYVQLGSIGKVAKHMWTNNLLFPGGRRANQRTWNRVTRTQLERILRNPNYRGDYVYSRFRYVSSDDRAGRIEPRPQEEWEVCKDHHDPYITPGDWDKIQAARISRRPTVRPPLGKGPALLQGLLWCPSCNRWLRTRYERREGRIRVPYYMCQSQDRYQRLLHTASFSPRHVDDSIVTAVLSALTPTLIGAASAAIDEYRSEQVTIQKAQTRQLQHAEDAVDDARQRYHAVDPDHGRVQADLEAKLEDALRRLDDLKRQTGISERSAPVEIAADDVAELMGLTANVTQLWKAPTTTDEDRKQLLRALISRITVRQVTQDAVDVELEWVGGFREPHRALRPMGISLLVQAMRNEGRSTTTIVEHMRAAELTTARGKAMTIAAVQQKLRKLGTSKKTDWALALVRIRELVMAGHQHQEIVAAMREQSPARLGPWTSHRLTYALMVLRRGRSGVLPLPASLPAAREKQRVIELIIERRAAGHTYKAIANELNASQLRPQFAPSFSRGTVYHLFEDWRRHTVSTSDQLSSTLKRHYRPRSPRTRSNSLRSTAP
jgi:DNA invertase Pin-like site-specific DNA recombinase